MKKGILILAGLAWAMLAAAQHTIQILVKGKRQGPLAAASVSIKELGRAAISDSLGIATLQNLPKRQWALSVSHVGYERVERLIDVPLVTNGPVTIILEEIEKEEQEVVVTSTRSSQSLRNIPSRVEVISGEELAEKANMRPGDIRMMLSESTGIQTQQVSATSANSSIRIQGLDGRYTQLLKDGFPLYAGFSGGLGLLQTPPLENPAYNGNPSLSN